MGLKRLIPVAAILLLASLAAFQAEAEFANADGFSGRTGFDCTTCHVTPHPTAPPADVALSGLPDSWDADRVYNLTITVTGGPDALPSPAPQGGFEMDAEAGHLLPAAGFEHVLRNTQFRGMTYLPMGTLLREWNVTWVAPSVLEAPETIQFWVAGMSASGNHVIATNVSDSGEKFDNVATFTTSIQPSESTLALWAAMPLVPPTVASELLDGVLKGQHADGNATHLGYRVNDGAWQSRPTAQSWRLDIGQSQSETILTIRSEGANRTSPEVSVRLPGNGADEAFVCDAPCEQESPAAPLALAIIGLGAFTAARRRSA